MPKSSNFWPSLRLLGIVFATGSIIASSLAAAEPQEIKVTEHNTTQTITDTGAKGDSPGGHPHFRPQ